MPVANPDSPAVRASRFKRVLLKNAVEAASLSQRPMSEMRPRLNDARQQATEDFDDWLNRVRDKSARFTVHGYAAAVVGLASTFHAVRKLVPKISTALADMAPRAGRLSAKHIAREVSAFSGGRTRVVIYSDEVIDVSKSYLIPRFASSAERYAGNVVNDIKRELTIGLNRAENVDELTARLKQIGGPAIDGDTAGESIAGGLFRRYESWAERIAQTESAAAYEYQARESFEQAKDAAPGLVRRWNAILDSATCDDCEELDGVTDEDETLPECPLHPRCRCIIGVWHPDWGESN